MIGVTIYGNSGKPISVIYVLSGEFNGDVCFVIRVTIYGNRGKPSVATARLDSASAWSPRLFQIGKTEPRLMAGLRLNHGLTSQNGYEELSYKYGKILIWASSNNTLDIQNTF